MSTWVDFSMGGLYNRALCPIHFPSSPYTSNSMNDNQNPDKTRRSFVVATSLVGGVATVGAAIPFVASMLPSERAKAAGAPIEVDIAKLAPGELGIFEWRGKPVWVMKRTPEMLEA